MGKFIRHEACSECGSSDGRALYADGTSYCFVCRQYESKSGQTHPGIKFVDLPARKLTADSCRMLGYGVSSYNGKLAHCAIYERPGREYAARKYIFQDKSQFVDPSGTFLPLFGMSAWDGKPRKALVITEGEKDAVSVFQATGVCAVSLPNGADSAQKSIERHYEWLCEWEKIIILFDEDKAGHRARDIACDILPPGKVYVGELPLKDANDMVMAGREAELRQAVLKPRLYKPVTLAKASELWQQYLTKRNDICRYPWSTLNNKLGYMQEGHTVIWTALPGAGKTAAMIEIAYEAITNNIGIGLVMLEGYTEDTIKALMARHLGQAGSEFESDSSHLQQFNQLFLDKNCYIFNYIGSMNTNALKAKIRFMAKGLGCKVIILDNLTMALAGSSVFDERKSADTFLNDLRTLALECRICIHIVMHATNDDGQRAAKGGKDKEENRQLNIQSTRGTRYAGIQADAFIALESVKDNDYDCWLRIIKNRPKKQLGPVCQLHYNLSNGRLEEKQTGF